MIFKDKDAFLCDMAETYRIYNFKEYPMSYIATLANGLREDSRSKIAQTKYDVGLDTMILASILDACSFLVWSKTEDAKHGANIPESLVKKLCKEDEKTQKDIMTFASPEDFERARAQIIGEV